MLISIVTTQAFFHLAIAVGDSSIGFAQQVEILHIPGSHLNDVGAFCQGSNGELICSICRTGRSIRLFCFRDRAITLSPGEKARVRG